MRDAYLCAAWLPNPACKAYGHAKHQHTADTYPASHCCRLHAPPPLSPAQALGGGKDLAGVDERLYAAVLAPHPGKYRLAGVSGEEDWGWGWGWGWEECNVG